MDLIHADQNHVDLRQIRKIEDYDNVLTLNASKVSDYKLTIPSKEWEESQIRVGHIIYINDTEWGGKVNRIVTQGDTVEVYGNNWREYLNKNLILPPAGQDYRVITGQACQAINSLMGDNFGDKFIVAECSAAVNSRFRYEKIGRGIEKMLSAINHRLQIQYDKDKVKFWAVPVTDWSQEYEFNEDYGVVMKVDINEADYINHVVALGKGELKDRLVIEAWLLPNGTITYDRNHPQKPTGEGLITGKLDYPNAESADELREAIVKQFKESASVTSTSLDLSGVQFVNLELGDIVASRDRLTGLYVKQSIDTKILKIKENGIPEIRYSVKEV